MKLPAPVAKSIIPAYGRRPLLAALVLQGAVYWGAKALTAARPHLDMTTALDAAVPFLPWTILIYVGAYLFWVCFYILAVRQGRDHARRFLAADALGKLLCFAVFLLVPTTNVRPALPAGDIFARAMGLLYAADTPDALFPSMHCFCSWLCWAGVRGQKGVAPALRAFALVFALAVAVSTLTTRQHVLADVAAGFALAELCWQAAGRGHLAGWYGRLWEKGSADG